MKINNEEIDEFLKKNIVDFHEYARPVGYLKEQGKSGGYLVSKSTMLTFVENHIISGGSYLEIGTLDGILLSLLAEKFTDCKFFAVDNFDGGNPGDFLNNNRHLDNVFLYFGSIDIVHHLLNKNKFDIIFIDGDHSYEWVKTDILYSLPLLKENSVLAFHDYCSPGVEQAVDEFFKGRIEGFEEFAFITFRKDTE